jgi:hypothetical protein
MSCANFLPHTPVYGVYMVADGYELRDVGINRPTYEYNQISPSTFCVGRNPNAPPKNVKVTLSLFML